MQLPRGDDVAQIKYVTRKRFVTAIVLIEVAMMKMLWSVALVALIQQQVPFRNNIPVAPTGLADRPLPKLPMEFDTAEGQRIRVVAVARGLTYPWSMAFLPDGSMLVTDRTGKLRII